MASLQLVGRTKGKLMAPSGMTERYGRSARSVAARDSFVPRVLSRLLVAAFVIASAQTAAAQSCPNNAHVDHVEQQGDITKIICKCNAGYQKQGGTCVSQDAGNGGPDGNLAALLSSNRQDVVTPPAAFRPSDVDQLQMCSALSSGLASLHRAPALTRTRSRARTIDCGGKRGVVGVDVIDLPDRPNSIALHYDGAGAEDFHWVQFVWREQVATMPTGPGVVPTHRRIGGFYRPGGLGGEQRQFTTDPAQVHYYVDMLRPGLTAGNPAPGQPLVNPGVNPQVAPNYETLGLNCRDQHRAAMIDAPGAAIDRQRLLADAGAAVALRSAAHFDSFLVSGGKVCAKLSWQVSHDWAAGRPNFAAPRYELSDPDISGALPNQQQLKVLNYTHPGQETLRP
jgi:hypothetical protein